MARKTTRKILPRSDKISYAELAKYASEVQEENTKLKISAALHKNDLASRDAAIAELQYQLRSVRTQLGLANEQCEDYRVAAAVNARLMTTFGELNEKLRYPPAERPDAKARPE